MPHIRALKPIYKLFSGPKLLRNGTYGVFSIMPKIPEISVGIQMEKSVSVSSDRNIRDHLWRWSTYFGWNIPTEIHHSIFDKLVLCPDEEIQKRNIKRQEPFLLIGPV